MTGRGGRKGRLSSDDIALWEGVTRSIKPLRKRKPAVPAEPVAEVALLPKRKVTKPAPASIPATVQPKPKSPAPIASLDRRTKQKIARGRYDIDARLDLHGHTQAQAHDVLLRFLRAVQARDGRVALVITGKGTRNVDGHSERIGALKRAVPLWLALPEFRALVIGFDTAAIGHGGEGALYVRLRKLRSASS